MSIPKIASNELANLSVGEENNNDNDAVVSEVSIDQINDASNTEIDPWSCSDDISATDNAVFDNPSRSADVKVFIPLVEPNKNINDAIIDLLDDKEVIENDEVTMIINSAGMSQPLKTTTGGLVKQENDPVSGDGKFNLCGHVFIYVKCY